MVTQDILSIMPCYQQELQQSDPNKGIVRMRMLSVAVGCAYLTCAMSGCIRRLCRDFIVRMFDGKLETQLKVMSIEKH